MNKEGVEAWQPTSFAALCASSFAEAKRRGFPVFLTPVALSTPLNATPYLARYEELRSLFRGSVRREHLLGALDDLQSKARRCGVTVEAVLIGGSFTELDREAPGDLDCLLLYRRTSHSRPVKAEQLRALLQRGKAAGVDGRFIPVDGDPLVLIKTISYFTTLYSQLKEASAGDHSARGLILVDCRDSNADGGITDRVTFKQGP